MISKGFYETIELIAQERRLPMEDVLDKVALALKKACALEGFKGKIEVEFNEEKKKIKIVEHKFVVEEIDPEAPEGQITLEEALEIKPKAKIGLDIKHEINIENEIGRKGATQFKQIFTQSLKELQRQKVYEFFKAKEDEIITARVIKPTKEAIILGLGRECEAIIPQKEFSPDEKINSGDLLKVYVLSVEEGTKGPKITCSRTNKNFLRRLLELEIPEIVNGTVEVMTLAREAGVRSKIGVKSNNPEVDAKGACIGPQSIRLKHIMNALNGEKIDIFSWSKNQVVYIAEAMSPARSISIILNYANSTDKKAMVIVPDDQFTLAVGKGANNVRLASVATGWKLEIRDETSAYREGIKFSPNVPNSVYRQYD